MANITRIKAKDDKASSKKETKKSDEPAEITRKVTVKAKNSENKKVRAKDRKEAKKLEKAEKKAARKAAREGKKAFYPIPPIRSLWPLHSRLVPRSTPGTLARSQSNLEARILCNYLRSSNRGIYYASRHAVHLSI